MMRSVLTIAALAFAAATVPAANGVLRRDPTRKLTIAGGDLAHQIELTDSSTLALSDVFNRTFLDSAGGTAAAPRTATKYEISFWLPDRRRSLVARLTSGPRLMRAYVYTPDAAGHPRMVFAQNAQRRGAAESRFDRY
jgi:hypothetical protein